MDEVEQRFVVKYFFSKRWDNKNITVELQQTFRDSALFSLTAKRWVREFKNGDLSCHDDSRLHRPVSIFRPALLKFLDRYPFSSTRVISRHLRISLLTLKEILRRELGLKQFNGKWFPHFLSDDHKMSRVDARRKLLSMLEMHAEDNSEGIVTGDEFCFQYSSCSDLVFAGSRESVVPRIRRDISGQQTLVKIFFPSR
jgi:hypothetical protein